MKKGLTPKQQRFVQEYLIDLNATQAAIRAGYSAKTARRIATENLSKPVISEAIQASMAKREIRTEIKQDSVLLEIARVAFSDPRKMFENNRLKSISEIDDDTAAAISSIKVSTKSSEGGEVEFIHEIKFWSKTSALEMGGKHLGMFSLHNEQKRPKVVIKNLAGDDGK